MIGMEPKCFIINISLYSHCSRNKLTNEETEIYGVNKIICVRSPNHDLILAITPKPKH